MLTAVANMQAPQNERATFQDFWTMYPKRAAIKDAEKAWNKLTPEEQVSALTALLDWRRIWIARDEMQFTPYPATWLNGARWMDDLPSEYAAKATHASHVVAQLPKSERGVMPDNVKAALAALRRK